MDFALILLVKHALNGMTQRFEKIKLYRSSSDSEEANGQLEIMKLSVKLLLMIKIL